MNTKKILVNAAAALALFSCAKEQLNDDITTTNLEAINRNEIRVCLDLDATGHEDSKSAKALEKFKMWDNGSTITLKFLGGSDFVQDKVLDYAKQWEQYANIKFKEVTSDDANIVISFDQSENSSWSYIGKDALNYKKNGATMNYGWLNDYTSEAEFSRVVLHEFGHALGAIHEHQNPDADIQWNKPVVYDYYESVHGWSEDQVDTNLFRTYHSDLAINSEYDPESIMHYFLDASFTLDGHSVGTNYYLSDLDKSFIGEAYPFNDDDQKNIDIPVGKTVKINANANAKYLFVNEDQGSIVETDSTISGSGNEFVITDEGDGLVSLKSILNGFYVCSDLKISEDGPLVANRNKLGAWEKFEWITNDDGTFSLLAQSTKKYVCADLKLGENAPLVANRTQIGAWEKFTWSE